MIPRLFLPLLVLVGLLNNFTALAQVVAPSQGGEVGLVLVTATTMEITFGTAGNGQGRVVAIAPTIGGMPVPLAATDETFYTAAPIYGNGSPLGQGYVIYNGTGNSATVTGLKPSTYYYVTSAEYNTDGMSILYNTSGASLSVATRATSAAVATPLPVELTSFTGSVNTRSLATLRWTTAIEQKTAYFALERSTNSTTFTELAQTAAAGNSNKSLTYEWLDKQPLKAITYYRLRQVDQDGSAHYSQVLALLPAPSADVTQSVEVYPTPSAGKAIQLLLEGYGGELVQLYFTDALGRTVMTQALTAAESHYLTPLILPQDIASGTYILTLAGNAGSIQKRVIISN